MVKVAPKRHAKREVPPHLLLAPTYKTALKFIQTELGGPWAKVHWKTRLSADDVRAIRSDYPESLWWIAKTYGDRVTGYDLAEAIKVWLKNNNAEDKSVCEVLKERGWEGVGEAEVFLSHVQAESPEDTLRAMSMIGGRVGPAKGGAKQCRLSMLMSGSSLWAMLYRLAVWTSLSGSCGCIPTAHLGIYGVAFA